MAIKCCFFDMGNVLVYFSHQKMCRNVADLCQVSESKITQILLKDGLQFEIERGEITEEQFHATVETRLGGTVDFELLKHAVADIFWLNESIVPLLSELREAGIRLVLLSNTSVTHLRFIQEKFDVLGAFDAITTSWETGALKPNAAIYEDAIRKANCPATDCFYTDDIEDYVIAARAFGINAEVYTDTIATRKSLYRLGVNIRQT